MSSNKNSIILTTTVAGSGAYAAGDQVAGLQTLTNALTQVDQAGWLNSICINDLDKQAVELDLVFFQTSSATLAGDNAAFAISDGDSADVIGIIKVLASDYVDIGNQSVATPAINPLLLNDANKTGSIYFAVITRGTPTYSGGVTVKLGIQRA